MHKGRSQNTKQVTVYNVFRANPKTAYLLQFQEAEAQSEITHLMHTCSSLKDKWNHGCVGGESYFKHEAHLA